MTPDRAIEVWTAYTLHLPLTLTAASPRRGVRLLGVAGCVVWALPGLALWILPFLGLLWWEMLDTAGDRRISPIVDRTGLWHDDEGGDQ